MIYGLYVTLQTKIKQTKNHGGEKAIIKNLERLYIAEKSRKKSKKETSMFERTKRGKRTWEKQKDLFFSVFVGSLLKKKKKLQ